MPLSRPDIGKEQTVNQAGSPTFFLVTEFCNFGALEGRKQRTSETSRVLHPSFGAYRNRVTFDVKSLGRAAGNLLKIIELKRK
jgi:hypothetical protein